MFQSFSDKWPAKTASWDGLSSGGTQASPVTTYKAVAKVRDEFGNTGEISAAIAVADLPSASGSTSIEAKYAGFAPKGESAIKAMDFALAVGQKNAVKAWKISIVQSNQGVQKTYSGDASDFPSSLSWDGTGDGGALAPEGRYTASLKSRLWNGLQARTVQSKPFILDLTPPSGTVASNPPSLTPDGKGGLSPMTFTIVAEFRPGPPGLLGLEPLRAGREGDHYGPGPISRRTATPGTESSPAAPRSIPRGPISSPPRSPINSATRESCGAPSASPRCRR